MSHQEIELKLKLTPQQKAQVLEKLSQLGAKSKPIKHQKDILFNCQHIDFKKLDQSLRLRIETIGKKQKATLTFKGTPHHALDGHKIRDEFTTPVDLQPTIKLLESIGFHRATIIKKTRTPFALGKLKIAIDELKFGTFLELEGSSEEIQKVRSQLGLTKSKPIKKGYGKLQLAWETKNNSP
jgi:predicted adenylyl cyclase CyaB